MSAVAMVQTAATLSYMYEEVCRWPQCRVKQRCQWLTPFSGDLTQKGNLGFTTPECKKNLITLSDVCMSQSKQECDPICMLCI